MPDTLTVTIMDKGHVAQVVAVRDSGTFSTPTLRTTPDLAFLVDSGGGFERTLYGLLGKAELQGITTTSSANDTATWRVPLNGEPSSEDGGHPEYHDAYTGESVELDAAIASGLVSEGAYSSPSIADAAAITNDSTVAKSKPVCLNWTKPGVTVRGSTLLIRAFSEAGEGVASVTGVLIDSATDEHTVAMSRAKFEPDAGWHPELAPGVAAVSVWEGTLDLTSVADGMAMVHIVSTGVNGAVADTEADGDAGIPVCIDQADDFPEYVAFVDESFTMSLTGTFTLAQDAIITGATSGVRATVEEAVMGTGGATTVRLVRITGISTPWTVGESISGLASGSATVTDGAETAAGSAASGVIAGIGGNTESDARAAPYDGLGRAQEYLSQARVTDGQAKNAGGCRVVILSRHFTKGGRTSSGFGFTVHAQKRQSIIVESDSGDPETCILSSGGESVARDQSLFCTEMRNIGGKPASASISAPDDSLWSWSSGDDVLLVTEGCRLVGLGPSTPIGLISGVDETWHNHLEAIDFNGPYVAGPSRDRINVVLWGKIDGKESDAQQVNGGGNTTFLGRVNDLRGTAAGTHGDVIQFIGACENVGTIVFADECSYQGIFSNNVTGTDKLRRIYVRTFTKQVNDGDVGAICMAFNQSVDGLIVDFSTLISYTATVGSEAGRTVSFNIISETGRSDNVWVRNSAFLGWGAQLWYEDGNANAPWAASCSVNNHTVNGTALGVRDTAGGSYATMFVDPWTNGGASPGNDDTDWRSKSGGPLAARVTARDLSNPIYDMLTGEAIAAGGSIGMAAEIAAATSPGLAVTDPDDSALASGGTYAGPTDIAFGADTGFQFTLTNDGDASNTLGTITVGTGYTIDAGDNPSGDTIAAGGTTTLTIKPATGTAGAKSATVTIPSDDPDSPYTFTVTATVLEAIAVTTPVPATNVTFDNAAVGGTLTTVGDAPMYHHRDHAVFGAPSVAQLTDDYPAVGGAQVHRASVWNGQDVLPILVTNLLRYDVWFGNPASGGTRQSWSINSGGLFDIMLGSVSGYRFIPQQSTVVGDRLIITCAVNVAADSRTSRVGIISAAMSDIAAGNATPFTVHYVSNEHGSTADGIGGVWMSSIPVEYAGSTWIAITDYASTPKNGGQTFILNVANNGTVGEMARMSVFTDETGQHTHPPLLLYDGSKYIFAWHDGDLSISTFVRTITDIDDFAANATIDTGSGIGSLYRIKNASLTDWSAAQTAAGPVTDMDTGSQNLFLLCLDPNDSSKFLKGADTDAGLIDRGRFDANNISVYETVFAPVVAHIPQESDASVLASSSFIADVTGQNIVALVSNEMSSIASVLTSHPTFSGVAYSNDGGQTFGWAWLGAPNAGVVQNCGVAVLRDGAIIIGSVDTTSSIRVITPGAVRKGKPLFTGFRPTNRLLDLDTLANDGKSTSADATVTAAHDGTTEKALPSIVHSQNGFTIERDDSATDNQGTLNLWDSSAPAAEIAAANMIVAMWTRRRTPDDNDAEWRARNGLRYWLWTAAQYGATGNATGFPTYDGMTDDWVRTLMLYDGSNVIGTPTNLRFVPRGPALAAAAARTEVMFESVVIDHDRPPLPYNVVDASGISAGKLEGLGLGPTWTIIAAMQVPEECWDGFTANEDDAWDSSHPILSIADSDGDNAITVAGNLVARASGGASTAITDANFRWEINDTESASTTNVNDYPVRCMQVIVAISKDADGAIQYAIATPRATNTGTRTMAVDVEADTIRFCNVGETDALEMYVLSVGYDQVARTASELATLAIKGGVPVAQSGGLRSRDRSRER